MNEECYWFVLQLVKFVYKNKVWFNVSDFIEEGSESVLMVTQLPYSIMKIPEIDPERGILSLQNIFKQIMQDRLLYFLAKFHPEMLYSDF